MKRFALITAFPTILIAFIILGITIISRQEFDLDDWDKIKDDYEVLNNIAIKYYNEKKGHHIFLIFGEDYSYFKFHDYTTDDKKIITNLSEDEKKAMRNVANFYPRQEEIFISEDSIDYSDTDAGGACIVRYIIKKKRSTLADFKHLTGNWYYFRAGR